MQGNGKISHQKTTLQVIGVLIALSLAVLLLWHGNANSMQATPALVAQVYFDGAYRIADGPSQEIEEGVSIPSTKGDVTIRTRSNGALCGSFYIGDPSRFSL